MATQFETAIMRLLIEQDLYKEDESDIISTPKNKWQFKIKKIADGWEISERSGSKGCFQVVAKGADLSRLIRYYIFHRHLISY